MSVLVAMSGGVDSSVAAALALEAGHEVVGVTLKLWGGDTDSGCCSVADVEDARRVAAQLGVDHYVFNLTDEFAAAVVDPYVADHVSGRTPNPCVACNRAIKFGRLLERADALGFDHVATGHHARVRRGRHGFELRRGTDLAKDQSYVLSMLGQRELARLLLPVGEMTKAQVRAHAERLGLRTAAKAESMDVCFVARSDRVAFVRERAGAEAVASGPVVDAAGVEVGRHEGVIGFTVGQRRGLRVAAGERRYVLDVDAATATVTVGRREELLRDEVVLTDVTFVHGPPLPGLAIEAQTRAHATPVRAHLDGAVVRFDEPQQRVAPGQVVALYDGDELVGGGIAA